MKPTTTSVFVSPVRPQNGRSRTVQGSSGRAAGAQMPSVPAAQDGQAKSSPGLAGGPSAVTGRRLILCLCLSGLAISAADAEIDKAPTARSQQEPSTEQAISPLADIDAATAAANARLAETCRQNGENRAPAMVAIRPGRFWMGSPENEAGRSRDEGPQHWVTLPKPFAISRCEITVAQFRQFIEESGYQTTAERSGKGCYQWNEDKKNWELNANRSWKSPGFEQDDQHPVVCVSWQDAQRYVDWLSQRSGADYRLPTEAEWEYAARASTQTARFYRDYKQCDYANGLGQETKSIAGKDWQLAECSDGYIYTAPVASFAANHYGLFDLLGNVWEWTAECWQKNYQNAPQDGSVWLEADGGNCSIRVVRGGSWDDDPQYLRSADRSRIDSVDAYVYLGFRVARAL